MNPLPELEKLLPQIIAAVPAAVAIIVGAFIVNFVLGRMLKLLADKTSLTYEDVAPFRRLIKWLVAASAVVLLLGVFGFNLGGLWAVATTLLGLVAIGFVAVWSVLSNVMCTFIILIFRPFAVGDEIEFAGDPVRGHVIDLNFVYTSLQTADGSVLQVPNNLFFQKVLKRRHGQGTVSLAAQLSSRPAGRR